MVNLRSRRLETLLRASVASASYEEVAALAEAQVGEDLDLDFKSGTYANTDRGKRDLATDVAAMANTAGGLIVLGMHEDDQGRAVGPTDMPVSDDEVNRMLLIIASGVAPMPAYDIWPLENSNKPGTGFILVAVPRSLTAPHAVLVNDSLRYPRRNGRTTIYLSESDVAQAYRKRFTGLQSRFEAAAEHEEYLRHRLNAESYSFVVVTLVPDLDGHAKVDFEAFRAFEAEIMGQNPLIFSFGSVWQRVSVGADRLIADGDSGIDYEITLLGCALHSTGAGSFAVAIADRKTSRETMKVVDEYLISAVMSGLRFLARHARDRAGAGGSASLRATIIPPGNEATVALVNYRRHGFENSFGREIVIDNAAPPVATTLADLDDLAEGGAALVTATHSLSSGIFQEFSYPEALQVGPKGELRIKYWSLDSHQRIRRWAEESGVTVTEDTIN